MEVELIEIVGSVNGSCIYIYMYRPICPEGNVRGVELSEYQISVCKVSVIFV